MSDSQKHGNFCWNELLTRDLKTSEKFYTELIGWESGDGSIGGGPYTVFKSGGKDQAGMMKLPDETPAEVPSHWMSHITVDDVDACAAKVKELGGEVLHGPEDIPTIGRFLILKDPTGATVGLVQFTKS